MEEVDEHEGQHGIISREHLKEMSIMLHVKEAESPIICYLLNLKRGISHRCYITYC